MTDVVMQANAFIMQQLCFMKVKSSAVQKIKQINQPINR